MTLTDLHGASARLSTMALLLALCGTCGTSDQESAVDAGADTGTDASLAKQAGGCEAESCLAGTVCVTSGGCRLSGIAIDCAAEPGAVPKERADCDAGYQLCIGNGEYCIPECPPTEHQCFPSGDACGREPDCGCIDALGIDPCPSGGGCVEVQGTVVVCMAA